MYQSLNFKEKAVSIAGREYKMEYDTRELGESSMRGFGNVYISDNSEEPMEFTFFTIQNKIAGYSPVNIKREIMSEIVEACTGLKIGFSSLLDDANPFRQ